jgi:hypothetical protein
MILAATSIIAPVVLKMGVCRQIPLIFGRPFWNTMKSTGTKEFLILTRISFVVPTRSRINSFASCRCNEVGTMES